MDNQQERPLPLAWLAGLVVGEGSFCFSVRRQYKKTVITPVFAVGMQDQESVDRICEVLDHHGLAYCRLFQKKTGLTQIQMMGAKRVALVYECLRPWLTGKKAEAADLVMEYINSRRSGAGRASITEAQVLIVEKNRVVNRSRNKGASPRSVLRNPQRLIRPTPLDDTGVKIESGLT